MKRDEPATEEGRGGWWWWRGGGLSAVKYREGKTLVMLFAFSFGVKAIISKRSASKFYRMALAELGLERNRGLFGIAAAALCDKEARTCACNRLQYGTLLLVQKNDLCLANNSQGLAGNPYFLGHCG